MSRELELPDVWNEPERAQALGKERAALEAFSKEKGLFSFYEDGHKECCGVRKIAPLKRKLTTLDAWITGQRKDQSPGTRTEIALCEEDNFPGVGEVLYKYNPLANWTSAQVWEYIKVFDVPFNELHNQGFISIGCESIVDSTRIRTGISGGAKAELQYATCSTDDGAGIGIGFSG